jgi:hypothetical protein
LSPSSLFTPLSFIFLLVVILLLPGFSFYLLDGIRTEPKQKNRREVGSRLYGLEVLPYAPVLFLNFHPPLWDYRDLASVLIVPSLRDDFLLQLSSDRCLERVV